MLVVARVVFDRLQEPPVGLVGGVARQHVEDEPLLDGLAHAVEVEGRERAVFAFAPEELQGLGLGGGGEGESGEVGHLPALFHLRQDRVLEFLLGRFGLGFLALRLLERGRRQHRLEALGALPGLGRMGLVHDQPEALAGELADLLGDDREFLERGDDDGLARLQRVLELARGGVDVLHHPQGLLELPYRGLELAVEHPAVGNDHDGVEDPAVIRPVQCGELVGKPGDGEALAAPGRVLDEVALPRPHDPCVRHEPAHAVELLIARKDEEPFTGLAPLFVFLLNLMDDLAHQIKDAVPRPSLFPEIAGGVACLCRRHGRVPGAAELAPVEGQKARLGAGQVGGDVD